MFRVASWNVRTMTTGLSNDLETISDVRKTAIINNELLRLQIDIAALQETRLADIGCLKESDYTFFWHGKKEEEVREYGVAFAVRNTLLDKTQLGSTGTERLLTLRLNTSEGPVNLLCVYAPTLSAPADVNDNFYGQLDSFIKEFSKQEALIVLGDFNARVGRDNDAWPDCLGHFGIGRCNENGQRLLELCAYHGLCVTNTFYNTKSHHRVSWRHPRSKHWHQLDLILTRRTQLNNFLVTRTFHSADCDTDHSLVCSKLRLQPKKIYHTKQEQKCKINVSKTQHPELCANFEAHFSSTFHANYNTTATAQWDNLKSNVYATALQTFGKKCGQQKDWYISNSARLDPLITSKRVALQAYKDKPSPETLQVLRSARSNVQKEVRACVNGYWNDLCSSIQQAADTGNIKAMFEGIKTATGPRINKSAPIKSKCGEPITDRTKQLDRWVEHYSELYATENAVHQSVLDDIGQLPVMPELDVPPSISELSEAIDKLPSGKAPGKDCIPAEVIKSGKACLLVPLHKLLIQCWTEGAVPQDMRDANIITLYKNKGDRGDCNNYRGISLLSIIGKLFARIVLTRLQTLAERIYPESQCGFRSQRSTIDMIFSVRQLQEKCREQNQPLYLVFIDLTKAFDLVSRDGLFRMLPLIGCPPKLLSIVKSFHDGMMSTVQFDGDLSNEFKVKSGVKQGCVLAPTLFGIFFSMLLRHAFHTSTDGVYLHSRSDGSLFNTSRFRAKTKLRTVTIRDMLFADDAALVSHSEDGLQRLLDRFSNSCVLFGLTISLKKTQVMGQATPGPPAMNIKGAELEVVHQFQYLGSTVTDTLSLDAEINKRIGMAYTTLSKLTKRVWTNKHLTVHTKANVYKACVISTLLYGSESWTTYSSQERKLQTFHLRCLRRILGITWKDKVTNNEVLSRAGIPSMFTLLRQRRLRWLGHIHRMDDGRIPKDLLYGQLATGDRGRGRPNLRFKDVCKRDLKACNINTETWESSAANRTLWKQLVATGLEHNEKNVQDEYDRKRARRTESQSDTTTEAPPLVCRHCHRVCKSRIGLFSHMRRCSTSSLV